ncbi:AzlC family ABC transporter permease [Schnuerera ultunensis]|nr:AzlC family ABC transporter permease [Schnuerera ultunensis]
MESAKNTKDKIKEAIIIGLPIVIGYFPIAMAFGLLSKNTSISFMDTSLLSMMVYAGASQFMALDLMSAGVTAANIILATFLLNLRHMMMSASLAVEFKGIPKKYLPVLAFGITDETFSVISFNKEKITLPFVFAINVLAYCSWALGTMVGYAVGEILPVSLQTSLSIGLYAMFASLLFPEIKKSRNILFLSIISALIYILIFYSNIFTSGWDIILGIIVSSILGVQFFNENNEEREN